MPDIADLEPGFVKNITLFELAWDVSAITDYKDSAGKLFLLAHAQLKNTELLSTLAYTVLIFVPHEEVLAALPSLQSKITTTTVMITVVVLLCSALTQGASNIVPT